jgi:hypothetical protein
MAESGRLGDIWLRSGRQVTAGRPAMHQDHYARHPQRRPILAASSRMVAEQRQATDGTACLRPINSSDAASRA